MNASGFIDPDGSGNGGTPYGLFKIDGEQLNGRFGRNYKVVGFDAQHRLQIGEEELVPLLCDAVEFGPALIVDGVSTLDEANTGFSLDPRTALDRRQMALYYFSSLTGAVPSPSARTSTPAAKFWSATARYRPVCWTAAHPQSCIFTGGKSPIRLPALITRTAVPCQMLGL